MKNKRIVIVVCIAAMLVMGAASWKLRKPKAQPIQVRSQASAIPDFEIYRQLFHHHVTMKQKADEFEKQGKDGKFLREFYKRKAQLNDDEAQALDDIAVDCERQVAQQDAKAKAIVDRDLAKNGNGKLAKDARPPEPSAELRELWNERNMILIRARYALQARFGDSEFTRFENYLKQEVVPHIVSGTSNPHPPVLGPRHEPKIKRYPPPSSEER